jgi:hypothetical protein
MKRKWLLLILVPIIYVGSYLFLVDASPLDFMTGIGPWPRVPTYRIGGKLAELFFTPIQHLDELIRPEYWKYNISDN